MVRIGGNSQEQSVLVSGGLSDGNMIEKGQTRDSRVRHLLIFFQIEYLWLIFIL